MCTILIEALTPLDRTSRIKMYKITLDPVSFAEELKGLFRFHELPTYHLRVFCKMILPFEGI